MLLKPLMYYSLLEMSQYVSNMINYVHPGSIISIFMSNPAATLVVITGESIY